MNVTLLLLSSACVSAQAPIVATGAGCNGCGSAAPTFASASFAASACGSCGTPAAGRVGLFDRLKGLFNRNRGGCGAGDCGNAPVVAAPCHGPCGSPIRSSFVASYTATAAPSCCGPVLRSSFPVGFSGCCDAGPAPRAGLFSRLRSRFSGAGDCGCAATAAPVVAGCTPTVGTVAPPVVGTPVAPPVVMPKPMDPVKEPAKEPAKEPKKTGATLPDVPGDLPRIPTLNGLGGSN